MAKFLSCDMCGNILGMIKDAGAPPFCCGEKLTHLEPNTVEASKEKHLPDVNSTEKGIKVNVGSVPHPMTDDHYIEFIYVETEKGGQKAQLAIDGSPEAEFCFANDKPLEVYAYCNLHGLWKTKL
jgi:superoxide reductase